MHIRVVGCFIVFTFFVRTCDASEPNSALHEYAKKIGKSVSESIELRPGVKLDLRLIPNGSFEMGTPTPTPVNESKFRNVIAVLIGILGISGLVFLFLVFDLFQRRKNQITIGYGRYIALLVLPCLIVVVFFGQRNLSEGLNAARSRYQLEALRASIEDLENDVPAHLVEISRPFYMGAVEVTQEQYEAVTNKNPSKFKGANLPVETVSWEDAIVFCETISKLTNRKFRLPTEAEWEYACRAGTESVYSLGDEVEALEKCSWYIKNSKRLTHEVRAKQPNAWGLYDMHGNVWECCSDWYGPYDSNPAKDPSGPVNGELKALRGGAWIEDYYRCRSASRYGFRPARTESFAGFRVVMEIDAIRQP